MATEQDILSALRQITDPDLNKDIVTLGFVKNIKIRGADVDFDIDLTTPACPVKEEFKEKAEALIKKLSGVKNVKVTMIATPRAHVGPPQNFQTTLTKVRSIIAVSSCKGGVGKSTVAALLAKELSSRGFKVGLLDADIYGPSVPSLFGLFGIPIYQNDKQQILPVESNNLKIMSFGFLLGDAPAVMRGPMVTRYIQQLLHQTDWGELDYLFIDMPPGTGDIQLTITQTVNLSGAVIVTTRQTLSLVDVARGILMFEAVSVPMLGIIENMSYFECDNCHKKHYIFGGEGKDTLKERFGLDTLVQLPILPELTGKLDKPVNIPIVKTAVDKVVMALGKMSIEQKKIPKTTFDQKNTTLEWPDGKKITVSNFDLRLSCRCALCVNEMTSEKLISKDKIKPDIAPKKIIPLGNYAIGIDWNDGHSSGIYPYKNIAELAGK